MLFSTSQDGFISLYLNQRFKLDHVITIALTAALVLFADQFSKMLIVKNCTPGPCRQIIPNFLNWTYERNIHGAFGLFGSSKILLIVMAVIVLLLFWMSFREAAQRSLMVRIAFGMIVGGAIGNIVDRFHYGYVIDFIDFYRIWPNIFNVADSCITIAVGLLIISSLAARRHR